MSTLMELQTFGERLGLVGLKLAEFISAQQAIQREDRERERAERAEEKDRLEREWSREEKKRRESGI